MWDDDLSKLAQRWAFQCPANNEIDDCRFIGNYCEYFSYVLRLFIHDFNMV